MQNGFDLKKSLELLCGAMVAQLLRSLRSGNELFVGLCERRMVERQKQEAGQEFDIILTMTLLLKGYKVLWITLRIMKNYKYAGIFTLIHDRIVKHFWPRRVYRWRHLNVLFPCTVLSYQDSGKIHVAASITIPSVMNRVTGVPGKVYTLSVFCSWKKSRRL